MQLCSDLKPIAASCQYPKSEPLPPKKKKSQTTTLIAGDEFLGLLSNPTLNPKLYSPNPKTKTRNPKN
jgi:hypothetical protein